MISKIHRFHGLGSLRPVYRLGKTQRSSQISLRYRKRRGGKYRAAVVVSKKIHKSAVKRNRIRRRIFEIIRSHNADIQPYDLIITVFSDQVIDWSHERLTKEINSLLQKSGALNR